MSTKLKFAQQLQGLLYPSTTIDAKLDEQTAMLAVSQARDEYVRNYILQAKVETNIVNGNWISSYDGVPITFDSVRAVYYSVLPANILSLDRDRGIQRVFNPMHPQDEYVITSAGFLAIMRNSAALTLEGERGCFLRQNKVIFMQKENEDCELSMDLIVSSDDIEPYDEFPVDTAAIPAILERALGFYQVQKGIPQDNINNAKSE